MSGSEDDSRCASEEVQQEGSGLSPTVCRLCRQRKTRCDRRKPHCAHCIKAGVECEYLSKQKKRGLRAGYVAELERRIDIVEQELQQLKQIQVHAANAVISGTNSQELSPLPVSDKPFATDVGERAFSSSVHGPATDIREGATMYELQHLSPAMMSNLCEAWFKEYQPWCPILDRHQVAASLEKVSSGSARGMDITLKALLCLTVSHSSPAISLSYQGRRRLSQHLRSEVVLEAMRMSRNQSLQALLIVVIYHYGYGNLSEAWNLLSICKRMCARLGLRKHLLSRNLDWQDLGSRMSWLTAAMGATSTVGASWDVELAKVGQPISHIPSIVDRDTIPASLIEILNLTVIGLHHVHEFRQTCNLTSPQEPTVDQISECEHLYQDLSMYRPHSHFDGSISSYAFAPDGSIAFDPNKVLTNIISNTAIITLYQPYTICPSSPNTAPFPQTLHTNHEFPPLQVKAIYRCLDAANIISKIISTIADADIEFICPFVGSFIFTAARFSLVFSKLTQTNTSISVTPNSTNNDVILSSVSPFGKRIPGFDLLMHALNMCGRRWPLARRLDIVLRAALVEDSHTRTDPASGPRSENSGATTPTPVPPLPKEFYDLRLSSLDVDDVLSEWVEGMKSKVYIGSLNGPYA